MGRNIKINCQQVYNTGDFYEKCAEDLKKMQKELGEITTNISNAWSGIDSKMLQNKIHNHIQYMENAVGFLEDNGFLLKNVARRHDSADKEFLSRMQRSDMNEQITNKY